MNAKVRIVGREKNAKNLNRKRLTIYKLLMKYEEVYVPKQGFGKLLQTDKCVCFVIFETFSDRVIHMSETRGHKNRYIFNYIFLIFQVSIKNS